jgi:hypothetical protein
MLVPPSQLLQQLAALPVLLQAYDFTDAELLSAGLDHQFLTEVESVTHRLRLFLNQDGQAPEPPTSG